MQQKPDATDDSKRKIAAKNVRVENRPRIVIVENDVRNKKRNERDREFESRRKINCSTQGDGRKRGKVGQSCGPGLNEKPGGDPINDGRDDEKKS